ncbi:Uncharacterized protein DAT39_018351 [Clarias magur]|uniref:Uncharacterized protein n=1 Tax=Clarias magur TaxID=1594786 RepID=A0A8J4TJW4_CLAMG|nr:Uncharacterized protein DAT39_018351 [Clarias magur]
MAGDLKVKNGPDKSGAVFVWVLIGEAQRATISLTVEDVEDYDQLEEEILVHCCGWIINSDTTDRMVCNLRNPHSNSQSQLISRSTGLRQTILDHTYKMRCGPMREELILL